MSDSIVELEVQVLHETRAAYYISHEGVRAWVPKSLGDLSPGNKFGEMVLSLPEWAAIDKELI